VDELAIYCKYFLDKAITVGCVALEIRISMNEMMSYEMICKRFRWNTPDLAILLQDRLDEPIEQTPAFSLYSCFQNFYFNNA